MIGRLSARTLGDGNSAMAFSTINGGRGGNSSDFGGAAGIGGDAHSQISANAAKYARSTLACRRTTWSY